MIRSPSSSPNPSSTAAQAFTMPRPCTPPDLEEIERHLEECREHGPKKALNGAGRAIAGVFGTKNNQVPSPDAPQSPGARREVTLRPPSDPALLTGSEPDSPHLSPVRRAIPGSDAVTPMLLEPESATSPFGSDDPLLVVATPPAQQMRQLICDAHKAMAAQGGPWSARRAALSNARNAMSHEVRLGVPKLIASLVATAVPVQYLDDQFLSRFASWTPDDVRAARDKALNLAAENRLPAPKTAHLDAWLAAFDKKPAYVSNRIQAAETLAAHGKVARLDDVIAQANRYASERGETPMSQEKVKALFGTCAKRLEAKARAAAKFGDDTNMVGYLAKYAKCYTRMGEPAPDMEALRTDGKAHAALRQVDLAFVAAGALDPQFKKLSNQARRRMVRAAAKAGAKLYGVGYVRRGIARMVPSEYLTRMAHGYIDRYKTRDSIEEALKHADAAQAESNVKLPDTSALRAWLQGA